MAVGSFSTVCKVSRNRLRQIMKVQVSTYTCIHTAWYSAYEKKIHVGICESA